MLEVLSKPLGEITTADIQSLIDEKVPEGERIEFKRGLPVAKGGDRPMDGWQRRNSRLCEEEDTRGGRCVCKCVWRRIAHRH